MHCPFFLGRFGRVLRTARLRRARSLEAGFGDGLAATRHRHAEAHDALRRALLEMLHARLTPEDQARVSVEDLGESE